MSWKSSPTYLLFTEWDTTINKAVEFEADLISKKTSMFERDREDVVENTIGNV